MAEIVVATWNQPIPAGKDMHVPALRIDEYVNRMSDNLRVVESEAGSSISYVRKPPFRSTRGNILNYWWAVQGSNLRPTG
jgi:hypothetical protein